MNEISRNFVKNVNKFMYLKSGRVSRSLTDRPLEQDVPLKKYNPEHSLPPELLNLKILPPVLPVAFIVFSSIMLLFFKDEIIEHIFTTEEED